MQANPGKFQTLLLGHLDDDTNISFDINGHKILPKDSVKLLGVQIDQSLSFNKHVSNICAKAAQTLNTLGRISKLLSSKTKMLIFNSFILCNFNYCPLVWHHCSVENMRKMEKIQKRGLRLVLNDSISPYNILLEKSKKNFLYVDRIKKIAHFVYKCINKCGPSLVHTMYEKKTLTYSLRDSSKTTQPKVDTT